MGFFVSLGNLPFKGSGSLTGGMKPTGGGGIGMIGIIGTTTPLPSCQRTGSKSWGFNGTEPNGAANLPVVFVGGRAVMIGKAVSSGRGPDV